MMPQVWSAGSWWRDPVLPGSLRVGPVWTGRGCAVARSYPLTHTRVLMLLAKGKVFTEVCSALLCDCFSCGFQLPACQRLWLRLSEASTQFGSQLWLGNKGCQGRC